MLHQLKIPKIPQQIERTQLEAKITVNILLRNAKQTNAIQTFRN